jgi:CheY-like chemotaxis protein
MSKLNLACVIDDDSIVRRLSEILISNYNIADKTLCFENGEPALDYLNKYKDEPDRLPELILLDIRMPIVDGWSFMEEYAVLAPKLSKKVAIYIVSSSINYKDHQRAKSLKLVSGFIIKPITINVLEEIVKNVQVN